MYLPYTHVDFSSADIDTNAASDFGAHSASVTYWGLESDATHKYVLPSELQRLAVDARFHRRTIITVTDSRFVCRDELILLRADAADAACLHHHMVFDMILLNNRLERDSLCYRPTFSLHLPPKRK